MGNAINPWSAIGDVLDLQAARYPEREALVHVATGARYTYGELKAEVDRVARGLMAIGIAKGQHVGIWATNYAEWILGPIRDRKDRRGYWLR